MASVTYRLGKNGRLKFATNEVARINTFTINKTGTTVDITSLGDDYTKMAKVMDGFTGSATGFYDSTDTYNNLMTSVALSGGSRSNVRFYIDTVKYFTPDVATDAESTCIFKEIIYNVDKANVVNFTINFEFSGPVILTS